MDKDLASGAERYIEGKALEVTKCLDKYISIFQFCLLFKQVLFNQSTNSPNKIG